jgi:hypothetical protein
MIDSQRANILTRNAMKGQRFADIPEIESNVTMLLPGIPENDFRDCFWQWHHRLTKCNKKSICKATTATSA